MVCHICGMHESARGRKRLEGAVLMRHMLSSHPDAARQPATTNPPASQQPATSQLGTEQATSEANPPASQQPPTQEAAGSEAATQPVTSGNSSPILPAPDPAPELKPRTAGPSGSDAGDLRVGNGSDSPVAEPQTEESRRSGEAKISDSNESTIEAPKCENPDALDDGNPSDAATADYRAEHCAVPAVENPPHRGKYWAKNHSRHNPRLVRQAENPPAEEVPVAENPPDIDRSVEYNSWSPVERHFWLHSPSSENPPEDPATITRIATAFRDGKKATFKDVGGGKYQVFIDGEQVMTGRWPDGTPAQPEPPATVANPPVEVAIIGIDIPAEPRPERPKAKGEADERPAA